MDFVISYVTAATDNGNRCTIVHSNDHSYDAMVDVIDLYHRLQHSHKGFKIQSLNANGIRGSLR